MFGCDTLKKKKILLLPEEQRAKNKMCTTELFSEVFFIRQRFSRADTIKGYYLLIFHVHMHSCELQPREISSLFYLCVQGFGVAQLCRRLTQTETNCTRRKVRGANGPLGGPMAPSPLPTTLHLVPLLGTPSSSNSPFIWEIFGYNRCLYMLICLC